MFGWWVGENPTILALLPALHSVLILLKLLLSQPAEGVGREGARLLLVLHDESLKGSEDIMKSSACYMGRQTRGTHAVQTLCVSVDPEHTLVSNLLVRVWCPQQCLLEAGT